MKNRQLPDFIRASWAACAALVAAAFVRKSFLGYTVAPVCSSVSTTGWNLLRITSVQVRCSPWGILLATSLGSASIVLLLAGVWLYQNPKDIITVKLVKTLQGKELTCLDLTPDQWASIPQCNGGSHE